MIGKQYYFVYKGTFDIGYAILYSDRIDRNMQEYIYILQKNCAEAFMSMLQVPILKDS